MQIVSRGKCCYFFLWHKSTWVGNRLVEILPEEACLLKQFSWEFQRSASVSSPSFWWMIINIRLDIISLFLVICSLIWVTMKTLCSLPLHIRLFFICLFVLGTRAYFVARLTWNSLCRPDNSWLKLIEIHLFYDKCWD